MTWIFLQQRRKNLYRGGIAHSRSLIQGAFHNCLFGALTLLFSRRSSWQIQKSISNINPIRLLGWVHKIKEWSSREAGPEERTRERWWNWWSGQNGVGILRCHSEEFDKGGIFGGDQAT